MWCVILSRTGRGGEVSSLERKTNVARPIGRVTLWVELGHFQLFPVFTGFEGPFEDGYAYGLRQDLATSAEKG